MESSSGVKSWQWVVTAIVIIILIVIGVMVFGGKGDEAPMITDGPDAVIPPGVNGIIMSDQYPGNVVYVSSVQVSSPGWVVIYKDNGGKLGAIIGTAYVTTGVSPARVNLTEPIVDGGTYYAGLHSDDGDSAFDVTKDLPLTDNRGNAITRVFRGSAAANVDIKG